MLTDGEKEIMAELNLDCDLPGLDELDAEEHERWLDFIAEGGPEDYFESEPFQCC